MNWHRDILVIPCAIFLLVGEGICAPHKVYVFLGETCPVSRHYTLTLRELHAEYAAEELEFIGVFPNRLSTPTAIAAFKEKYLLPFSCIRDSAHTWVKRFGITVVPEVVVVDSSNAAIYQGRIDNAFARVGRRRRVVTERDLADVLNAIRDKTPPAFRKTQAIGCFITPLQPEE